MTRGLAERVKIQQIKECEVKFIKTVEQIHRDLLSKYAYQRDFSDALVPLKMDIELFKEKKGLVNG